MASEKRAYDRFLTTKLLADSQLVALVTTGGMTRVYEAGVVPQGAAMPFVSFGMTSFLDRNAMPADKTIFSMPIYFVRATVEGRDLTVGYQLQDRIDEALRGQFGSVVLGSETYWVGKIFRKQLLQLPPETEGTKVMTQIGIEIESRVQRL